MATYYIDGVTGDDSADGLDRTRAWRSLERANRARYRPGDRIIFASGTRYHGRFTPHGSGTSAEPIRVTVTAPPAGARIDACGQYSEAILLENVQGWELEYLELTNHGDRREEGRAGARIRLQDFGQASHIHLRALFIHDVNGSLVKGEGDAAGYGIVWQNHGSRVPSRFHDLRIEDCHLLRCDRNGICGWSGFYQRSEWHPSTGVVIRRNRLEDIGGDGIVPIGTEGCLIEHNRLDGGRCRAADYAAGIWPWSCDRTVIQFNEVSGMKGDLDGQAFDSDDNCVDTLIQYNYSHDNDGGFVLVCSCGDAEPGGTWLRNTIVRYNISQNDRTRLFHIGGPVRDVYAYNNTFLVDEGQDVYAVLQTEDNGWPDRTHFWNNIFYTKGKLSYAFGESTAIDFRANAYYGRHENQPQDAKAITADPCLLGAGTGGEGLDSLDGYRLAPESPCIGNGVLVRDNGGRDFWGNAVAEADAPDIGAHSASQELLKANG